MYAWETILLYLVGLLGVLVLGALLVWGLFYLYSYKCDKDSDLENDDDDAASNHLTTIRTYINNKRREQKESMKQTSQKERSSGLDNSAGGHHKQTMLSSLHRQADNSDVVVASALSSIPLRELGGRGSEIIVDVGQQMYLNREELDKEEHQCIVCRSRKEIAWSQVSCYARTTIGVLVYKRPEATGGAPNAAAAATAAADATGQTVASTSSLLADRQPVLAVLEELRNDSVGLFAVPPSTLSDNTQKYKTVSTLTIAPSPDSRLQAPDLNLTSRKRRSPEEVRSPALVGKQTKPSLTFKSAGSSRSARFSNKSPPPPPPSQQVGGVGSQGSGQKSPTQTSGSSTRSPQSQGQQPALRAT